MYWLLCLCASFAILLIVMVAVNLVTFVIEPLLVLVPRSLKPAGRAQAIFALRLFPALSAALLTLGLVVPAFLKLEPAGTQEPLNAALVLMGSLGAVSCAAVTIRILSRLHAGMKLATDWQSKALRQRRQADGITIYEIPATGALVATVGIRNAAVFVSSPVIATLTPDEFSAVVAHEMAHVSACDNLKRILMSSVAVPRVNQRADRVWALSCEMTADERAVAGGVSPIDLASALIKVSRLAAVPVPASVPASSLIPAADLSAVKERVEHLLSLSTNPEPEKFRRWLGVFGVAVAFVAFAFSRPALLMLAHEAIERLVR